MTQTSPSPNSGTLNGGKGKKTIRQHSYSSIPPRWTFFCSKEVKSELTDLLQSQGGLITNLEGVFQTISKSETASNFRQLQKVHQNML
jgi:hypothetical protein